MTNVRLEKLICIIVIISIIIFIMIIVIVVIIFVIIINEYLDGMNISTTTNCDEIVLSKEKRAIALRKGLFLRFTTNHRCLQRSFNHNMGNMFHDFFPQHSSGMRKGLLRESKSKLNELSMVCKVDIVALVIHAK